MRFVDILKDKSMNIVASGGDPTKVQEVVPYLLSVLWAANVLNCEAIMELRNMMTAYFGPGISKCLENGAQVDEELKALFKNLMPLPQEINIYFRQFCDQYDIDVEKFSKSCFFVVC